MKKYLYISLLVLTLASCGDKAVDQPVTPPDTPEVPEQRAMSFAPASPAISRAAKPMQETYDIFCVWSYKATASSTIETVMPGYQVKFINTIDRWQYDGTTYTTHTELTDQYLKYWDESAVRYDFNAIAPYPLPAGVDLDVNADGFSINNLTGHVTAGTELVVAHQRRTLSPALADLDVIVNTPNDHQPATFSETVPLVFHRIFNRVQFRIYNTGTRRAVVNNIDIDFADSKTFDTKGSYTQTGWGSLSTPSNSLLHLDFVTAPLTVDPIAATEYVEKATDLVTFCEIPQGFASGSELVLTIDIGGEPIERWFPMPDAAWSPDKDYIYYIHLDVGDKEGSPIFISLLSVAAYKYGGSANQTQTNW